MRKTGKVWKLKGFKQMPCVKHQPGSWRIFSDEIPGDIW
jgi:hypothetical protein